MSSIVSVEACSDVVGGTLQPAAACQAVVQIRDETFERACVSAIFCGYASNLVISRIASVLQNTLWSVISVRNESRCIINELTVGSLLDNNGMTLPAVCSFR